MAQTRAEGILFVPAFLVSRRFREGTVKLKYWDSYWHPIISGIHARLSALPNGQQELRQTPLELESLTGLKPPRDLGQKSYWESAKRGGRGWKLAQTLGVIIELEPNPNGRGVRSVIFKI